MRPRSDGPRWLETALVAGLVLLLAGCGRGVTLVPVAGVVKVDGKPLQGGAITVAPADGRPASAVIGPDGRFTLSTFEPGDGVTPGRHQVTVVASRQLPGGRFQWLVPKQVRSLDTSPLLLEVTGPTTSALVAIDTAGEKPEIESLDGGIVNEGLSLTPP
jgi:hypothetical protein